MTIRTEADVSAGLEALLKIDPRLRPIAAVSGALPLRLGLPGYAGLAHIVVSQMVSRASADAIWARICAASAGSVNAETYLAITPETAATLGLSRAKEACLRGLAEAVVRGDLDLEAIAVQPPEEAIARLTALKGIGLWTAEVYLMFCGGHPDIFPAGDVALRIAVGEAFGLAGRPDIAQTAAMAEAWRPWRSLAARLFWAYYAIRKGRSAMPAT